MPVSVERERAAIEADEQRIIERRKKLIERERAQVAKMIDDAGLMKVEPERLSTLLKKMKILGIDEVEKRLAA